MNDREVRDIINSLNDSLENQHAGFVDGVGDVYAVSEETIKNILTRLKEQEAVEPYSINAERTYGICPRCGKIIFRYGNVEENHYCGVCGKKVKWE